jgi:hypothetical protein
MADHTIDQSNDPIPFYKLISLVLYKGFIESYPYIGVVFALLFIHYISVFLYKDYCVITYYNLYNFPLSVSPLCSYLLDVITICNGTINKMSYIFAGFIIFKITGIFSKFNVFSKYSKRPTSN